MWHVYTALALLSVCLVAIWIDQWRRLEVFQQRIEGLESVISQVANNHERTRREVTPKEANVEFIHPKLRKEMDTTAEDPNNPWVWLTSYSRIPVSCDL